MREEINPDSILILCNQAIVLDSTEPIAYTIRGNYYNHVLSDFEGAFKDMEKAVALNPNGFENWWSLGVLHIEHKNYILGLQELHKAEQLTLAEPSIWLYHYLALTYLGIGDVDRSME